MYCLKCGKFIGIPADQCVELYICQDCAIKHIKTKDLTEEEFSRALENLDYIYSISFQ